MNGKTHLSAEAGATAALFSTAALTQMLAVRGLLSADEINELYAMAASMCRANGSEEAAHAIELMVPTSVGIDAVAAAKKRGASVEQK